MTRSCRIYTSHGAHSWQPPTRHSHYVPPRRQHSTRQNAVQTLAYTISTRYSSAFSLLQLRLFLRSLERPRQTQRRHGLAGLATSFPVGAQISAIPWPEALEVPRRQRSAWNCCSPGPPRGPDHWPLSSTTSQMGQDFAYFGGPGLVAQSPTAGSP